MNKDKQHQPLPLNIKENIDMFIKGCLDRQSNRYNYKDLCKEYVIQRSTWYVWNTIFSFKYVHVSVVWKYIVWFYTKAIWLNKTGKSYRSTIPYATCHKQISTTRLFMHSLMETEGIFLQRACTSMRLVILKRNTSSLGIIVIDNFIHYNRQIKFRGNDSLAVVASKQKR